MSPWVKLDNSWLDKIPEVGPGPFSVYATLKRYADASGQCYPSVSTLVRATGMGEKRVRRAIKTLVAREWIEISPRRGESGAITSNLYRLPEPPKSPPDKTDGVRSECPEALDKTAGYVGDKMTGSPRTKRPEELDPIELENQGNKKRSPSGDGPTPQDFVARWNAIPGVQQCRKLTAERRKHFRARTADPDWTDHLAEALARIGASEFCRGGNDRGWRADVDWFLRPDTLTRVIEGKYDGRQRNGSTRPTKPPYIFSAEN